MTISLTCCMVFPGTSHLFMMPLSTMRIASMRRIPAYSLREGLPTMAVDDWAATELITASEHTWTWKIPRYLAAGSHLAMLLLFTHATSL